MPGLWLLLICLMLPLEAEAAGIRQCAHPDGRVEWRDRPCPPGSDVRSSEHGTTNGRGTFSTIPANRPPPALLERAKRARRRHGDGSRVSRPAGAASESGAEPRCVEYEKRIDAINRRLRKGYSVSEGNELRAERRRIERALGKACR